MSASWTSRYAVRSSPGGQWHRLPDGLQDDVQPGTAATAGTFLVGVALLVLAARAPLTGAIRAITVVGGVAGLLAGFFFPVFLFWLAAIVLAGWTLASGARQSAAAPAQHQPV